MRFRNSIHLLMENFKHVYKLLLYKVIIALLSAALIAAFVWPEIDAILTSDQVQGIIENTKNFFKALVSWDDKVTESASFYLKNIFGEDGKGGLLRELGAFIGSMKTEIILVLLGIMVVYLVTRFVDTLFYFAIGSTLNDKMSTYADTPFSTAFITNLGKASAYAGLYVPVVFLFDVLTIAVCCALLMFLPLLAGLFLSVTLIVVCQSLKLTFTGPWMPAMTADNKPLREAIRYKNEREKRQISKVFTTYVVSVYLVIIVNVIAAVCTFGSALLITVPASYLLFICQQYVHYYTMKGKDYFITYEGVATNPDFGDSEHFFEYIEEGEKTAQKSEEEVREDKPEEITVEENAQTEAVAENIPNEEN